MRFLFVSVIARYQLCNPHGEGVLDGLARLHRWYAPVLFAATIVMGHVYEAYMMVGAGGVCCNLFFVGRKWARALLCSGGAVLLGFLPSCSPFVFVFQ